MEFNYAEFKKDMQREGHRVTKHGDYITVEPNNNAHGYSKGFGSAWDFIPEQYYRQLKFVNMDHFNNIIYKAKFKIM